MTKSNNFLYFICCISFVALFLSACTDKQTETTDGSDPQEEESAYTGNFEPGSVEWNVRIPQSDDDLRYNGRIQKTVRWMDKNGENTVIFAVQPPFEISEDLRRTRLYAYQYYERDTIQRYHFVNESIDSCFCDCDYTLLTDSIYVDDLNGDQVGEVWFLYSRDDRCDVSPVNTRLRMWSGPGELIINGYTQLWTTEGILPEGMPKKRLMPQSTISDTVLINRSIAFWEEYLSNDVSPIETGEGQ